MLLIYTVKNEAFNFIIYPLEMNEDTTLHDIGCSWMVSKKESYYIGKEALTA